jgi:hypothetical protein
MLTGSWHIRLQKRVLLSVEESVGKFHLWRISSFNKYSAEGIRNKTISCEEDIFYTLLQ